jgi:DNA-binding LacI/PurR family transcriptional regulator
MHSDAPDTRSRKPRPRRAVISDVARLAGVSNQTVSRVINDSEHVRPGTRERVLVAMRQLDYRPNSVARALVTGRSKTLGVITFDTTLHGPASTLLAIERAAHEVGYFITIASLKALDRPSVLEAVERLRLHGVDGILVIAPQEGAVRALVRAPAGIPLVAVVGGPAGGIPVAASDQLGGAASATRHLLELGHRTVWHIAGPADWLEAQQRVAGWRTTLQAAGVDVPPPLVGDWSPASGYKLGRRLAADPAVTAIFVANDQMALGTLRALHEAGRAIPGDVSLVGFDDIPEAPFFTPPLTTVRQNFDEMGRRSLRLLLDTMESVETAPPASESPLALIVRASTSASPSA